MATTNEQLFRTIQEWFEATYRGEIVEEVCLYVRGRAKPIRLYMPICVATRSQPGDDETQFPASNGLSECAADVLSTLREVGHRLTTTQLLSEFSDREFLHGESTVKTTLARMVREKVLNNRSDISPKGYGFPEWK